jgi:pSer/pThr/pTyr-binding forkhead associated (FHA) protein
VIQFRIVSGKKAGATWVARRFPVRIGRDVHSDLCLEEEGVWERHLGLHFDKAAGIVMVAEPRAITSVNGERVEQAVLRNGDLLEIGSARLQFLLGETRQVALAVREWLTWFLVAGISLGQIALVYWLLRSE